MSMMSRIVAGGFVAAAVFATAPAQATDIPDGNVSSVGIFNPTIDLTVNPNTFTATTGATFQISGAGGFAGVTGGFGSLNGVLNFSTTAGATINQSIANFFTFSDGTGHDFQFSVDSVKTVSWANTPGVSSSFSLYLLGSTVDTFLGYDPTATSLTLVFGSTGNSPYSLGATLTVPPAPNGGVPEPATWALTLIGFGAMGAALRRRPRVSSVSFA
jgi:PEP-CTERM motif